MEDEDDKCPNLNNRIIELEKQVKDLTLTNKDLEFQLCCLIDENELELKSPSPKLGGRKFNLYNNFSFSKSF